MNKAAHLLGLESEEVGAAISMIPNHYAHVAEDTKASAEAKANVMIPAFPVTLRRDYPFPHLGAANAAEEFVSVEAFGG